MNLICVKCNYVLDLEIDLDDGTCPRCQGMVYQEGDVIEDHQSQRFLDLVDEVLAKTRLIGPQNKLKN